MTERRKAAQAHEMPGQCENPTGLAGRLKQLGSESLIYGLSTILGRFLVFLLQPFYVSQFSAAENGIQTLIYVWIPLVTVPFVLGLDVAYMRNASLGGGDTELRRQQAFTMAWASILVIGGLCVSAGYLIAAWLGETFDLPAFAVGYVLLLAYTDALLTIPWAHLRMTNQAKRYSAYRLGFVGISVVLNLVLILGFHWRVEAIFFANLAANLVMLMLLSPVVVSLFRPGLLFRHPGWKALWAYALPIVPASFFVLVVENADRILLDGLSDSVASSVYGLTTREVVGIYGFNYKLGVVMLLVVQMFRMAWTPFSLNQARAERAPQLFARVMTGLMLVCSVVFLGVVLFLPELTRIPAVYHFPKETEYWLGLPIVPIILLGYMFSGVYAVVSTGLYIERKTKILPWIAGFGAAINVLVCYWARDHWGMVGVAWATPASYLLMSALAAWQSNRHFYVPYEWTRLIHLAAIVAGLFVVDRWLETMHLHPFPAVLAKLGLIGCFPVLLVVTRFFRAGEWDVLHRTMNRMMASFR